MSLNSRPMTRSVAAAESLSNLPLTALVFFRVLQRLEYGKLIVRWVDGREFTFTGRRPGPFGVIIVNHPSFIRRIMKNGAVGFAESYLDKLVDTPDLVLLLENLALNIMQFRAAVRLPSLLRPVQRFLHSRRANTRKGARRNIAYHYNLGNDFYSSWLDPSMTYSCAIFKSPEDDLEQAQINKWDRILEIAGVTSEDRVLEIGCGWGSFAAYAAKRIGCRIVALTISEEQYRQAVMLIKKEGLDELVDVRFQDYRDVKDRFDKVISVEMFEAVGARYWPGFFNTLRNCLKPGGLAAFQVITIKDESYAAYRRRPDFTQTYIFPGGILPSLSIFKEFAAKAGFAVDDTRFFGPHYAKTLGEWLKNFDNSVGSGAVVLDQRFVLMWRYYLAYCIAAFSTGNINVIQTVLH